MSSDRYAPQAAAQMLRFTESETAATDPKQTVASLSINSTIHNESGIALMKSEDIARIVRREIDEYKYEQPEPETTVGVPWSEEKMLSFIPKLEKALVAPYKQRFYLRDTYDQVKATDAEEVTYWVVAEADAYIEFYDPAIEDFGLASAGSVGELPNTIGVRGDIVGVFAAM